MVGNILVKNDGEGRGRTIVAIEDPLIGSNETFERLSRLNGQDREFARGTALVRGANTSGGIGGRAGTTVGSARSRAGRGSISDGGINLILAIRETINTDFPRSIQRRLNGHLSFSAVGDIAIQKVETSGVSVSLNIKIAILAMSMLEVDVERRRGVRGD